MGNNLLNCCENSSSKQSELALSPAKNRISEAPPEPETPTPLELGSVEARVRALNALVQPQLLTLRVLNSGNLPRGHTLFIEPLGLQGSLRKACDGYVFFGNKKKLNGAVVNDFVVPLHGTDDESRDRHFVVYFSLEKGSYWVRDLGKGLGVYIKLDFALVLKDKTLLNIGETFLLVTFDSATELTLRVYRGEDTGFTRYFLRSKFLADKWKNFFITVGRTPMCSVTVDDPLISKVQCTLFYNEASGWTLVDGEMQQQLPSTNGTWLYANEDFELYTGTILKFHQTLLQVSSS